MVAKDRIQSAEVQRLPHSEVCTINLAIDIDKKVHLVDVPHAQGLKEKLASLKTGMETAKS